MIETFCSQCKSQIFRKPSRLKTYTNHFCNRDCHSEFQRHYNDCKTCGKKIGCHQKYCCRACSNKGRYKQQYKGSLTKNKAAKIKRLKQELFSVRGHYCERCTHSNASIIQLHHKTPLSKGGTDAHDNLELLCPNCHAEHHYGT